MKSVIITGGSGLLAINIAFQLKDEWRIFLIMNNRYVNVPGVDSVLLSLDNEDSLRDLIKQKNIDLIIHTAGLTNVERCEENPDISFYANAELAKKVAKVADATGVKMIHISTDHLYNGDKSLYTETDAPSPINNYGKHKWQGEKFVQEYNPSALIIRTNFFGWGTTYRYSFSDFILNKLKSNQDLFLFSDVHFTPIFVNDLAYIIKALFESGFSGVFNVASPTSISKHEFGLMLAEVFGFSNFKIHADSIKNRIALVPRPLNMSLSVNKLETSLNIKVNAIEKMLENLKFFEQNSNTLQIKRL